MTKELRAALDEQRPYAAYSKNRTHGIHVNKDHDCREYVVGECFIDAALASAESGDEGLRTDANVKCLCGHWRRGDGPNSGHLPGDGLCTVSLGDEWCPCMGFRAAAQPEPEPGLPCGFEYPTYRCDMPESVHRGEHPFQPYDRRRGERRAASKRANAAPTAEAPDIGALLDARDALDAALDPDHPEGHDCDVCRAADELGEAVDALLDWRAS